MTAQSSRFRHIFLTHASQYAGLLVVVLGGLVLAGWRLEIAVLKSFIPGLVWMNPTTAFTFILSGASLGLLQVQKSGPWIRQIGRASAGIVTLIGGIKLGEYLFGWNFGSDLVLFGEKLQSLDASSPVRIRIAPNTALNFFLLGLSLWLLDRNNRTARWIVQCFTLTAICSSLFALIGYSYDVKPFYSVVTYIPMAFSTAFTFVVLGIGVILGQADFGVAGIVSSEHLGGVIIRRLLPVVVFVPIALGWLRLQGERSGLFTEEFGIALFASAMVVIAALLLLWNGWSMNRSDIERKRAEEARKDSEERFRQIVEHAQEVSWIATVDFHKILYVSPAYETIWGRSCESLYARPLDWIEAIHPEEREAVAAQFEKALHHEGKFDVEYRIVRPDGSIRHIHDRGFQVRNNLGQIYRIAGIATDISDYKSLAARLEKMAHHDALTGLPNRILFYDRLNQALVRAKRNNELVAVLYYDLDNFKSINDLYGHELGDLLLSAVAERLKATIREVDTICRLGGDEFTCVLPDISDIENVSKIAGKIIAELNLPFHLRGRELFITVSIGISLYPKDGLDPEELVRHADSAMYRAKREGKNKFQFHSIMADLS
jgi:diguanylate cyclase (GGDEF)-like protein/PAS domain S-box-containing protein